MPSPTREQIVGMLTECSLLAHQMEHMRNMSNGNVSGDVAGAYRMIANDYEFKLRDKINKLWLYMCDSIVEF
jgi:hypothetical protein